ncbi:hypothetical protein ABBQ32_006355 [Trebouxia sp. C0010 RCD-2024]
MMNKGNSCFQNAVVQATVRLPPFRAELVDGTYPPSTFLWEQQQLLAGLRAADASGTSVDPVELFKRLKDWHE